MTFDVPIGPDRLMDLQMVGGEIADPLPMIQEPVDMQEDPDVILADPEPLEDEDEPEAEAMDQNEDGEGGKLGSDKEFDLIDNLRLYLDPEIEFDFENERAMGRAVRDFQECIKGFLLRFVSWSFKPTFSDLQLR